ncbi:RUS1 FAMILY PROTEIN C16ORF58 [Salix koriyanagi]|uniref:RUS1 FAMILY PROTEIN C16ORF58 n=1 Tax=Salix koriyanagi TaxID=2511006 RepID=A0A9Q0WM04_9ROSI|nr:RUS1 FAMILY PROTEIN C16ORF58 [Salix koriyanagi]
METGQALSPEQVSRTEHVLPTWITSWSSKKVKLLHANVRLGVRVSSLDHQEMMEVLLSARYHYLKASDVLQSYIHALVMAKLMGKSTSVYLESQSWMDKQYEVFLQKLSSSGWKTGRLLSPPIIWKANWTDVSSDDKID